MRDKKAAALESARRHCREIARREGRNFYSGMRLLPRPKRDAMFALYAFSRRIDDIADGGLPRDAKLAQLTQQSQVLDGLVPATTPDSRALLVDLNTFEIPPGVLQPLIRGAIWDVESGLIESQAQLLDYCRNVAGSVGKACSFIYGARDAEALAAASDLGVALQLTNICRDVREDFDNGRSYLPGEDLRASEVDLAAALRGHAPDARRLGQYLETLDVVAQAHYQSGMRLLTMLDRRSAASCAAMAMTYRELQTRIMQSPMEVLKTRVRVPTGVKLLVAVRALGNPRFQGGA